MAYKVASDILVLIHLAFILFILSGGILLFRWRRVSYFHLPSVIWAALLEFNGWICPLTPLEISARLAAGDAGYEGGFIEHYILPLIYPENLPLSVQTILGIIVIAINGALYLGFFLRQRKTKE